MTPLIGLLFFLSAAGFLTFCIERSLDRHDV